MIADSVPISSLVLERLTANGVDLPAVLKAAGIAPQRVQGPRARITTREFFAFWRSVEQVSKLRDLGLRLGSHLRPYKQDVSFVAAQHSANLGDALAKLGRYKRLLCPEEVALQIKAGEARVRFHWLLAEEKLPMLIVDGAFAAVMALARVGLGRTVSPLRVELTRKRSTADAAMLRDHFGCPIRFDASVDLLVLDAALLDEPFKTHNEELLAVLLPGLEAALNESGGESLADRVRRALRIRMEGERPSVEKVARELHLSSRTLQRRLGEAGTTYQELLDEVRREAARRLLTNTDLDAGEVAFLLGFEELNSFTRAFQSWEGTTPNRFRAAP